MEGMMAGAAVGMGGALISGGAAAFTSGGIRGIGQAALQFAKSMPKNFVVNAVESVGKFGLAMRGVMGVQNTAATYGNTGSASLSDFKDGVISMETGAIDSAKLIYSDMTGGVILNEKGEPKHAGWQDYLGMVMMFAPVGQGKRDLENSLKNEPESVGSIADDAEGKKADEEDVTPKTEVQDSDAPKQEGEHEAFSSTKMKKVSPDPPFEISDKHKGDEKLEAEYDSQLKNQQDAINDMSVKDWLQNREDFKNRDKQQYGTDAKKARDEYRKQEIGRRTADNMLENGGDYKKAKQDAVESMKGQAALHNPDGIAGGKVNDITGMGDSRVNSSLGSQWDKGRASSIESQVKDVYGIPPKTINDIPDGDLMNVNLF
jgi:hypothetical protein